MCRLSRLKLVLLGLVLAFGTVSASVAGVGPCPPTATDVGKTTGIKATRGSGGNAAQGGIFQCDTLLIDSFVGWGGAGLYDFVGVTANMFVNGVDQGSIAPPNFTTTVVGDDDPNLQPPCNGAILKENLLQFGPYSPTATDIANGFVTFQMQFTGKAQSGNDDPITGSDTITVTIISCDDNDPCTIDNCDPVTGCTHPPLCTDPCIPCVVTGGVAACTPIVCDPCQTCVGGVCGPTPPCPDPCSPCVNGVCTPVSCPDPCQPCVGGVCTAVVCPDPCFPCVNGACDTVTHCGNTGCTPGFFKNCVKSWPSCATPSTKLGDVGFVSTCAGCIVGPGTGPTFLVALQGGGGSTICGAQQILLRAAAAAYLNACFGGYPITSPALVVQEVNAALVGCDRATILAEASKLDGFNNLGCKDATTGIDRRCLR